MHARAYAHAWVSVDTETTGLHVWEGHRLRVLQIAVGDEVGVWDTWKDPEVLEIWRPVLEGRTGSPKVVYHNAKFDLAMLHAAGLKLPPWQQIEDTYLASVLLDNAAGPRPRQTLKALAERHLGRELPKELQKSDWSGEITQDQVDYAAADARATLDLANLLLPKLDAEELRQAYEIEVAVVPIITELGLRGVRIDPLMWAALAENAERANRQAKLELDRIAGLQSDSGTVNWGSWQQVLKLLQARGLQIFSTNEAALTEHAGDELVDALLTYRSTVKSVTTYGVSVLKALDEHERFHADYNQADTRTGRMTADIIHQMPRDGGYREAVKPVDGRVLIHADYSQLQVIIVADLAEARSMIEAFNNNVDIHTQTASLMAGIPLERVTPGERQSAKALNFGLLFGAGAATLQRSAARDYGVHWSEAEAQARRNRFFEAYPEIKTWHRKRPGVLYRPELDWPEREVDLPVDLISDSGRRRKGVEKYTEKHNSPVQMMEVDGVKCGLALLDERLKASGLDAQIVMIVHDEVDLEASEADAPAVKELVQQALEEGMNRWLQHTRARIDVDIWRDWKGPKKGA
jgi:DNA polymerase-1